MGPSKGKQGIVTSTLTRPNYLVVQTPPPNPITGPGSSTGPLGLQQMPPQQQVPTTLASGAGASNPFAGLTGARYAGQVPLPNASLFGPDRKAFLNSADC